jgi:CRISPR-associated protein Csb2
VSLILEIEFLTGVCRAARGPGLDGPDWPPQPDRVFSALVAAWAEAGGGDAGRAALAWLEAQAPPTVHASGATARTAPDVYVPPNDARASTAAPAYLRVMPDRRGRQPRRFPVARPDDPCMALVWEVEPGAEDFEALAALARDVARLGHSASLVRCAFRRGGVAGLPEARPATRRVYPGRLSELERAHAADPARPRIAPGASVAPLRPVAAVPSGDWLVLEALGAAPDPLASAALCRLLRRALMAGYERIGRSDQIPAAVSGHETDGRPTAEPHIAAVPMSFVGHPHSDGRLMGLALVPPAGAGLLDISWLREAFEAVAPWDPALERRVLTLEGPPPLPLRLAPAGSNGPRSLDPAPYLAPARVWATVTPLVLDRHLKAGDEAEMRALVAQACLNAGLPRPDPERIAVGKHAAVAGAPSARRRGPPWTLWRRPEPLASRPLVHAVIGFDAPVAGPVLLGAGRFTGLGLCRGIEA